jgi:hypothetical protein
MKTRKEMIEELTLWELRYLMDNHELLKDTTQFFADGGFGAMTDAELYRHYILQFEEELK